MGAAVGQSDGAVPAQHCYAAFGLVFRSSFALPFAAPSGERPFDVVIREGRAPAALAAPVVDHGIWQADANAFLLHAAGVARFLVRCGWDVVVAPRGGSAAAIGAVLNVPVMAALLQQRGLVTLHASAAVRPDGGAVLVFGLGKSALLAALVDRGYRLLADDFTAIAERGGELLALPACPALRLWLDVVEKLGWDGRPRSRVNEGVEKYLVPAPAAFHAEPVPVSACCLLADAPHGETVITPVARQEALRELSVRLYREFFAVGTANRAASFRCLTALAKEHPTFRASRAVYGPGPADAAEAVDRHLQALRSAGEGG